MTGTRPPCNRNGYQSYQSGIEIVERNVTVRKQDPGINRTKVELKLTLSGDVSGSGTSINRTKVELKLYNPEKLVNGG